MRPFINKIVVPLTILGFGLIWPFAAGYLLDILKRNPKKKHKVIVNKDWPLFTFLPEHRDEVLPSPLPQHLTVRRQAFLCQDTRLFFADLQNGNDSPSMASLHGLIYLVRIDLIARQHILVKFSPTLPSWVTEEQVSVLCQIIFLEYRCYLILDDLHLVRITGHDLIALDSRGDVVLRDRGC